MVKYQFPEFRVNLEEKIFGVGGNSGFFCYWSYSCSYFCCSDELELTLKRERRMAEKSLSRSKKMVCFNCRQPGNISLLFLYTRFTSTSTYCFPSPGHVLADCTGEVINDSEKVWVASTLASPSVLPTTFSHVSALPPAYAPVPPTPRLPLPLQLASVTSVAAWSTPPGNWATSGISQLL